MKNKILLLFAFSLMLFAFPALSQQPSKKEMQSQMQEVINNLNRQIADLEKQITEAKKNKEEPKSIKEKEEQLMILKKQVGMMYGLNTGFDKMADNTFQPAGQKDKKTIPEKDNRRISKLPKKDFSDAELVSFVRSIFTKVETKLPAEEVISAKKIYNEVKTNYTKTKPEYKLANAVSNAATGCWVYGHWQKAIWLAGKAYLEDVTDLYKLNNYASYLSMLGCEDLAIPILKWLNEKRPESSTVMNNLGQAWYGLGDMDKAKQYLKAATAVDQYHSIANHTLSKIYTAENNYMLAIPALKASMKYCYTPEKEFELEKLGGQIEDEDIDFNYPMGVDPFGFEAFFKAWPPLSNSLSESPIVYAKWTAYWDEVNKLEEKLRLEEEEAIERARKFAQSITDPGKGSSVMKLHYTNAWVKANKKMPLALTKRAALTIEQVMDLMAQAYHTTTTARLNALEEQMQKVKLTNPTCKEMDGLNQTYLNSANAIIAEGLNEMNKVYLQHKREVQSHIRLMSYSSLTDYGDRLSGFQDEFWKKNQWIYRIQWGFVQRYRQLRKFPPTISSACVQTTTVPEQTWQLPPLKKPDCTHTASINFPIGSIKEKCNTIEIDESQLEYKRDNSQKGEIKKVMEEIGEIINQAINPLNITPGEPTIESDPADLELELQTGDIEIIESDVSDGRKLGLEMGEITIKQGGVEVLQNEIKILSPTPSTSQLSLGFDAAGNVMVNTSRIKTFF